MSLDVVCVLSGGGCKVDRGGTVIGEKGKGIVSGQRNYGRIGGSGFGRRFREISGLWKKEDVRKLAFIEYHVF